MEELHDKEYPGDERLELNEETLRLLWSKTYNADGKPDWSHIFPTIT